MKKTRKARKAAALLAAVMTAATVAGITASAESAPKFEAAPKMSFAASTQELVTGTPESKVIDSNTRYEKPEFRGSGTMYEEQKFRLSIMRGKKIKIDFSEPTWYDLKSSKLYGRRVVGIAPNGEFLIGDWELLDENTENHFHEVSGDYVAFAYSGDITWGTDFPFSRVFWNEPYRNVSDIRISWGGGVRNASITITVDHNAPWWAIKGTNLDQQRTGIWDTNCSSHSEWKP